MRISVWMIFTIVLLTIGYFTADCYDIEIGAETKRLLPVRIGIILDGDKNNHIYRRVLEKVIRGVRHDLEGSPETQVDLELATAEVYSHDNGTTVRNKVCHLIRDDVIMLIGPPTSLPKQEPHLVAAAELYGVPYIDILPSFTREGQHELPSPKFTFTMFPDYTTAVDEIMGFMIGKKTRMLVLYDTRIGVDELNNFHYRADGWRQRFAAIPQESNMAEWQQAMTRLLLSSKRAKEKQIVLITDATIAYRILKLCTEPGLKMMTEQHHYIVTPPIGTSSDEGLVSFELPAEAIASPAEINFMTYQMNVTFIETILSSLRKKTTLSEIKMILPSVAAAIDSVTALTKAVRSPAVSIRDVQLLNLQALTDQCEGVEKENWFRRDVFASLRKGLLKVNFTGLTGEVAFDEHQCKHVSIQKWSSIRNRTQKFPIKADAIAKGRVLLKVFAILQAPYVYRNLDTVTRNRRPYRGILVDVLDTTTAGLGINYIITETMEGSYEGLYEDTMFKIIEIQKSTDIDIFLGLPETSNLQNHFDFAGTLLTTGTVAIARTQHEEEDDDVFAFMRPFDTIVWLCILFLLVVVTLVMYCLNVCYRDKQKALHKQKRSKSKGRTNKNAKKCATTTNVKEKEVCPKTTAGRVLSGIWGLFSVIVLGYYTANLTAFLAMSKRALEIKSLADLSAQDNLPYGLVNNSFLHGRLKISNIALYQQILEKIKEENFLATEEEGIHRTLTEQFAYLGDTNVLQYGMKDEEECDIAILGPQIVNNSIALAMRKDSDWLQKVARRLKLLRREHGIEALTLHWIERESLCNGISQSVTLLVNGRSSQVTLAGIGGVLVVLVAGVLLSIMVAMLESVWWKDGELPRLYDQEDETLLVSRDELEYTRRTSL
ncbi:glutamate receptor ionotropic, kainate 3-like [Lineus longissimus]|uniref:glutamate receptor ionotropic, kainate 3-like n=1 Tax=Lineus longissimus TaxID=88925 RepID=UPI002B4F0096